MTLDLHDKAFLSRLFRWAFIGFTAVTLGLSLWTQHQNAVAVAERRARVDQIQADSIAARDRQEAQGMRIEAMLRELIARN